MKSRKMLIILCLSAVLCLTACGKQEEKAPSKEQIEVTDTQLQTDVQTVPEEKAPDIETITREEFRKLSPHDIQLIAEQYIGDYKAVYGISKNHEMTDADWATIGGFMEYQLFGKLSEDDPVYKQKQLEREKDRIMASISGNDASYMIMNEEYIMSLSEEEFLSWFKEASQYYGIELTDEELSSFNTKEKINALRDNLIQNIKEARN